MDNNNRIIIVKKERDIMLRTGTKDIMQKLHAKKKKKKIISRF